MLPSPAEIFERLSRAGHRITSSRRAVIHALHAAGGAVTVRDLHATLGDEADLVTVYRTLAWLASLRVARQVAAGGGAERFELAAEGEQTHHLLCEACRRVFTVPARGPDTDAAAQIRRDYGFIVSDQTVTFRGTCADCSG